MTLRSPLARLLPLLLLAALSAAPAAATGALSVEDLLKLSREGVGEPVLLSLAKHQGVQGPLTAGQVLAMSRAGFGDELLAAIVEAAAGAPAEAAPAPEDGRVVYEERDGAVMAIARGEPGDPAPPAPPPAPPERAEAPAPSFVVIQQPSTTAEIQSSERAPEPGDNPYPTGAVHGFSGSTVFLPARFGGNPSAFGRTIVTNDPNLRSPGWYPYPFTPAPVTPVVRPAPAGPPYGSTTIRTSRGPIRIPN